MKTKVCSKCLVEKPISEFNKATKNKDGLFHCCKECLNKYRQTKEYKAIQRKHKQSAKGKKSAQRYEQSQKAKITRKKYTKSDECKIVQKRYWQTEKGKANIFRNSRSEKAKETRRRYKQTEKCKKQAKDYNNRKRIESPEIIKAREAVHGATRYGKLPYPNTLKCVKCGKQAQQYHHYIGYAKEHWLDVEPVCRRCHTAIHYE